MSDPNTPVEPSSQERGDGAEAPGEAPTGEAAWQPTAEAPTASPPRLAPRPLERPEVDPEAAAVFGRPEGIEGGFAARRNGSGSTAQRTTLVAPPPAALASAFGRPDPSAPSLQRPSENGSSGGSGPEKFWTDGAERDPWRDPESVVALGPPPGSDTPASPPALGEGARLSVREVLFGRRVEPRALAALAAIALLIGA